jgi:AcrR family transcriptional regulator
MRTKDKDKVDLIFNASLELISKEGTSALTMSKIAKYANISTGTVYIYFKNKEELLHKLYLKLNKESNERFLKEYDSTAPFKIGLKKVWINYLKHRIEHYEESVFLERYYKSNAITLEEKALAEDMKSPVHQMIRRGKKEMLIKNNIDDEMLFLSMLGFIRELADEHIVGVYKLDKDRIESAFQLSWDTIKA